MCYPFYQRMITCLRGEILPQKMCSFEAEDFLECIHRDKQVSAAHDYRPSRLRAINSKINMCILSIGRAT